MSQKSAYADLEIRISERRDQGYRVDLRLNNGQEFPPGYLDPSFLPWTPSGAPAKDGQCLFDWLLADDRLKMAWAEVRGQCPRRRLRLWLDTEAPELHALPWELLREEAGGGMPALNLAAAVSTPFSRYLAVQWQPGSPIFQRTLKVLVAIANPNKLQESRYKLTPLNVADEWQLLQEATAGQPVELTLLPQPCTLKALAEALDQGYHVLHFLGHGFFNAAKGQATLLMAGEDDPIAEVTDQELAELLARHLAGSDPQREDKLRLIVLASCQSATHSTSDAFRGLAPKLVAAGVPAVLAMQDKVQLDTAREFSCNFYHSLLAHGQVDLACNEARSKLLEAGLPGVAIPVLFMRLRDGQLLGRRGKISRAKPQSFWEQLLENIAAEKCLVFLGPRANTGLLPDSHLVAEKLLENRSYPLPHETNDLAKVMRYMSLYKADEALRWDYIKILREGLLTSLKVGEPTKQQYRQATLSETIAGVNWAQGLDQPSIYHQLADLPIPLYLTTNVDNFMFEALKQKKDRTPHRLGLRWQQTHQGTPQDVQAVTLKADQPIVLHLNGHDDDQEQFDYLVLSEDDYLAHLVRLYTEAHQLLPANIITALSNYSLLFLGYSLDDWEFRVIWQGLLKPIKAQAKINVDVQLELDLEDNASDSEERLTLVLDYLHRYMRRSIAGIDVYWGTPQQFVAELHHEWQQVKDLIEKEQTDVKPRWRQ
jgi:hypothetical protein